VNESHRLFVGPLGRSQLIALDAAAALGFALVALTATVDADIPPWARLAIPLGLGLPLALRRVWPLPVFLLTLVLAVAAVVSGAFGIAYMSPAYALYLVAATEDRGSWLPTTAIGALALLTGIGLVTVGVSAHPEGAGRLLGIDDALFGIAALGGAWTVGRAVRERRMYAARQAERLAEQAVAEERLRIARELHDVVTHNVGLIAVKAGVANHVLATKPEEAHDALRVIETASRNALVEMRHLLGVLRSSDPPARDPAPGLHGLSDLAQQARQAGVDVRLDIRVGGSQFELGGQDGVREAAAGGERGVTGAPSGEQGVTGAPSQRAGPSGRDSQPGESAEVSYRTDGGADGEGPAAGADSEGERSAGGGGIGGARSVEGRSPLGDRVPEGEGFAGVGGAERTRSAEGGSPSEGGGTEEEGFALGGGGEGAGPPERRSPSGAGNVEGEWRAGGRGAEGEEAAVRGGAEGERAVESGSPLGAGRGKLPEGVELSVYRIVQEALTNVVKHAAPARCLVSVVDDGRVVRIEVADDGPGHRTLPGKGTGHGLIGMRERVMMYGGTFEAGALAGQGFRVSASLPYGDSLRLSHEER